MAQDDGGSPPPPDDAELELPLIPRAARVPGPVAPPGDATPRRAEPGYSLRPPAAPSKSSERAGAGDTGRPPGRRSSRPPGRGASPSRIVAIVLSTIFAIIGAVPLAAGLLVRTSYVQDWAARETARLLREELGTRATYRVRVRPWPLTLSIEDLVVDGDDGRGPFLTVERASVRPRIFSLMAGRLDVGDVDLTGARARVVVRDGELVSLRPKPSERPAREGPTRPPFAALAITDADLDLDVEGTIASVREVDLDVVVESDGAYELAARAGAGLLTRLHEDPAHPGEDMVDEDRLCHLEARARFEPDQEVVLVRRLGLAAVTDFDPAPGTRPRCDLPEDDWRRVDVRLGALRARLADAVDGVPPVEGRVAVAVPAALIHRFVDFPPTTGAVRLEVDLDHEPGERFPVVTGRVRADYPGLDGKVFSDRFEADVRFADERLVATRVRARWADGDFTFREVVLAPFAPGITIEAEGIVADGVELQGLLRDLDAHPQSHVGWAIAHVEIERFGGTLSPLDLSGALTANTRDFGVYDRPSHLPGKQRMISVDRGDVRGTLAVRQDAVFLENMHLVTPRSDLHTTVMLGYEGAFGLDVFRGARVDLGEISPLVSVPIGGRVTIEAHGTGTFDVPRIVGDLSVDDFSIGGFEAGDVRKAHAEFVPLSITLTQVELEKNASLVSAPRALVAFDTGADVLVDADVDTTRAPHLSLRDFFEVFHFDDDPRFASIAGTAVGTGRVHYVIGGPEDRCGGGKLDVVTRMGVDRPLLFGERYDRGELDVRFRWFDQAAGDAGMDIDVVTASLRDGSGSVLAEARVKDGGKLRGSIVASGLPLSRLEAFGALGGFLDGEANAVGTVGGTLARPEAELDVTVGPLRFGADKLPASRLAVRMEPDPAPPARVGVSRCGNPIGAGFDRATWERDLPGGQFRIDGQLFDGQIRIEDLTVSQQRDEVVKGRLVLSKLDLGKVLGGMPKLAFSGQLPQATLSATIDLENLESGRPQATKATAELTSLEVERGGRVVQLVEASGPVTLDGGRLIVPALTMSLSDRSGLRVDFAAQGRVDDAFGARELDATLSIAPFDLARLKEDVPAVSRPAGTLSGSIGVTGPLGAPVVAGWAKLRGGALGLVGMPLALEGAEVDVAIGDGELRVTRATASVGAGTLDVTGRMPLSLGAATGGASITVRGVRVPVQDGIELVADADLEATLRTGAATPSEGLPEIRGNVRIVSFDYTRPIALSLDLGELSRRIGRSEVEAFDPAGDVVRFDVNVLAQRPLVVRNDLADMRLEVVEPGIQLSGTNQRYGAKGALRILPESKMRLRNHEFDVREGWVRFDDPTKIKADVDVRAQTEVRRYQSVQSSDAQATSTTAGATTGGQWNVSVHAHGTTENMRLDLASDPPLDQEDILLLLAVGMTRAEIDRGLATSLGETVGLEALSALTGADQAVKSVVPIIDYFHFGSSYSARTARTEPNVTVGKRLTDDVRASVTTTLTQRDVAATLEWRLRKGLTLQGAYDNNNDIGSIVGNLGADLRWRLEFE